MSRCYILGAGFSKPFGLPLASELTPLLFTHAYSSDFWQPYVRDTYLDYLRRLYPKMDFESEWPDFEDLVTMLNEWESFRKAYEQTGTPQEGLHPTHFKEVLLKHLGYQLCEQGERCSGEPLDLLRQFVEKATANQDTIVSFNWDVLVEIACEHAGGRACYGGQTANGLQIAKPHGSLNVAALPQSEFQRMLQNSISAHRVYEDWRDGDTVFVRPDNTADARKRILYPFKDKVIVEPTGRKTYASGWINLQWRRSLDMLRSAEEIIVIGYSLPQQDFRPRLLMQLAGWDPAHQPPVTLIGPHAHQLVSKYEEYVTLPITSIQSSWIDWFRGQP